MSRAWSTVVVRHLIFVLIAGLSWFGFQSLWGQVASTITDVAVEKKPNHADGAAMATVRGQSTVKGKVTVTEKKGRIASHALQAWKIKNGQGALLLMSPEKKGEQNRLRYYDLDAGQGRFLGHVPFATATVTESSDANGPWAFAVSGVDTSTSRAVIFVGDAVAVRGRIEGGSMPRFTADSLSFQSATGPGQVKTAALLGEEALGQIYTTAGDGHGPLLQFLPNGEALTTNQAGQEERGRWLTDGSVFHVTPAQGAASDYRLADLQTVSGVPATSRLTLRLLQPLSSRTAKEGTEVKAVLISPGVFHGGILLPQGSEFDGKVTAAHGVGLAIKHETAAVTLHFYAAKLPDGRVLSLDARISKIENSQESVNKDGKIQGIRSTGTIGHSAENQIASLAQIDPVLYIFTATAGPAVLGFAEPEILYNAGTELDIEFNQPLITAQKYEPRVPTRGGNAVDAAIAAAATLTIVEPVSNGLGSDAFAILWDGKELIGLNASGTAPAAWNPDYFKRKYGEDGKAMPSSRCEAGIPSRCRALSRAGGRCTSGSASSPLATAAAGDRNRRARPCGRPVVAHSGPRRPGAGRQPGFAEAFMPHGRAPSRREIRFQDRGGRRCARSRKKGRAAFTRARSRRRSRLSARHVAVR